MDSGCLRGRGNNKKRICMRGGHQCAESCDISSVKTEVEGNYWVLCHVFFTRRASEMTLLTAELRGASRGDQTP